jgi:hypothetical protein
LGERIRSLKAAGKQGLSRREVLTSGATNREAAS